MAEKQEASRVEGKLMEKALLGEVADFSSPTEAENDPKTGAAWSAERVIPALTIIKLCTQDHPETPIHAKGIRIKGARITGTLDFEAMKLLRPLCLQKCSIENSIILTDAETKTLNLDGTHVPGISASRVKIRGSFFLQNVVSTGEVRMVDAQVEGSISGAGARFKTPKAVAFNGTRMNVGGSFTMLGIRQASGEVVNFESDGEIRLIEAKLGGSLGFEGATLRNEGAKTLDAERLTTKGGVYLRKRFSSFGRIKLHSAQVEGIFECSEGTIHGSKGIAIEARGIRVKGAVLLRDGFTTHGVVNLSFAHIGATLEFHNVHLTSEGQDGLSLEGSEASVGGSVIFTEGSTAQGPINLDGSSIGGNLTIENAIFAGSVPAGKSLFSAARIVLKQNLDFDNKADFHGKVCLVGSDMGGNVNCQEASFINAGGTALEADLVSVKGEMVFGKAFKSDGELRLVGSKAGAGLRVDCKNINNPEGVALNCDRLVSGGTASFENSEINGELRLTNAEIGSDLLLTVSKLGSGVEKTALRASGMSVKGSAFLNGKFEGDVSLAHAQINGELNCESASFSGKESAFDAANIKVVQTLTWKGITLAPGAQVNLNGAAVGSLRDDCPSWPNKQQLSINDFSYASFAEQTLDTSQRLAWLRSQRVFSVQPYEQLIRVLRNTGHDKEARQIARAKQDDLRELGKMGFAPMAWSWLNGKTIGHGYQLWRALIASLIVILLGTFVFYGAFANGFILPVKDRPTDYAIGTRCPEKLPCFNPVIYSLDVFLPIVDLRQESYWLPVANKTGRSWFEAYYWLHIILGWVFTTLSVAGLTGLVKKE